MKVAFVFNRQREKLPEEAEFDTPDTINAIHTALSSNGDDVISIEMTRDGRWIQNLIEKSPDVIFNTSEGFSGIGRESLAPITFEQIGIPYVGCGPYSCFLTLDKFLAKQVVARRAVPTPEGYYVSEDKELRAIAKEVTYPVFIKPNFEGSSKGITPQSICHSPNELLSHAKKLLIDFPQGLIVEQYVDGKDITVPYVFGLGQNGILEPLEYVGPPTKGSWIYDYNLKNLRDEDVQVRCPAQLDPLTRNGIIEATQKSVEALGIVDMGRADFRVTPNGDFYFIEFNALPSLQPGAGLFESTRLLGLNYNETIQQILLSAVNRTQVKKPRIRPSRKLSIRNPQIALVYNLKRKEKKDSDYEGEAEFDSQNTINDIASTIKGLGYPVVLLEATRNLALKLEREKIDVVFNIAEGSRKRTRESQVPAICDLLGIEHTGSDATCLAITLDKSMTSKLVSVEGILAPKSKLFTRLLRTYKHNLRYPIIVKPNFEGTSKGIYSSSVVSNDEQLKEAIQRLLSQSHASVLCEEYIEGREFTVGVIGYPNTQILGPMEILFKEGKAKYPVYSFEAKQCENQRDNDYCRLVCPADLSSKMQRKIARFAKKCSSILGCRDITRIDFRVGPREEIYFLEINPLPGLSPGYSDLAIMAESLGWSYDTLIAAILNPALQRWRRSFRALKERKQPPKIKAPRESQEIKELHEAIN